MLGNLKEICANYINGMPNEEVLGIACLLTLGIVYTFKTKLLNTVKLIVSRLGEILAVLVVLPVTVIVIMLGVVVHLCTILLAIVTGIITVAILTCNLIKDLLQDLTSYVVDNYGRENNDR